MPERSIHSVLVIDDDRDDFDLVAEVLHSIDPSIEVHFLDRCQDGDKFKDQPIDLIFLDINMPAHDGFSWLKGIRGKGYDLPIIMYTNSSNPAHVIRAYGEGATLFFNKPESYQVLVQGLKKLLSFDWSDPFGITNMHLLNGKYQAFEVA